MGSFIKKVAITTCLILVAVLFLGVFSVFTFAPKLAGDKCFELGLKNVATTCYERVYKKTGEFDDLITLVDNVIFAEDTEMIVEYLGKMVNRKLEFEEFCKSLDEQSEYVDYSSYDYYVTTLMMAYYKLGNKTSAANFAFSSLTSDGYEEGCALYYAVKLSQTDADFFDMIVTSYKGLSTKTFTGYKKFREDLKAINPDVKF